jgi:hypothetical protein
MIESVQVTPLVSPNTGERARWIKTITPETTQYKGSKMPIYRAPILIGPTFKLSGT